MVPYHAFEPANEATFIQIRKKKKEKELESFLFNLISQTYIQILTILLSPVMLDSSIASECPEIKMPSAGT